MKPLMVSGSNHITPFMLIKDAAKNQLQKIIVLMKLVKIHIMVDYS